MTEKKAKLLETTYETLINVAFGDQPVSDLTGLIPEEFMAYGTAPDEKVFGLAGARFMLERQKAQAEGQQMEIKRSPVHKIIFSGEKSALVVEEFAFIITVQDSVVTFPLRLSTLLTYEEGKWIVLHFHGSSADANINEGESWPMEGLRRRNIELEKLIAEKTADLREKNHELEIEASLERVRGNVMSMRRSDELIDVCKILLTELQSLGFQHIRNTQIAIANDAKGSYMSYDYYNNGISYSGELFYNSHPFIESLAIKMRQNKESFITVTLTGPELDDWRHHLKSLIQRPAPKLDAATSLNYYYYSIGPGGLGFCAYSPLNDEEMNVLKRFKNVFDLAYRRYSDVALAESQAREAKIEAALERVRSRAMAMHKTEDLDPAVAIVFEELNKLDLGVLRCGISVLHKETRTGDVWLTTTTDKGPAVQISGDEPFDIHPLLQGAFNAWLNQEDFSYILKGDDLVTYFNAVKAAHFQLPEFQFFSSTTEEKQQYCFVAVYHGGGLFAFRDVEFSDDAKNVMKRFASVFDLTYKRFIDLQNAETNAREATIEAALERVRGKAMAMHNSNDLSATASTIFTELRKLGIRPIRSGVGLLSKESRKAQLYSATSSPGGDSLALVGWVVLKGHPVLEKIYDSWNSNEDYYPQLQGEELKNYYELLLTGLSVNVPDWQSGQKQYGHFMSFSVGCLYAWSETPYNDEQKKVLKRFATIVDLTFRRYMELQQSEANAKETVKQAALDRIRADIASMRAISDLDRITPLIWNELTILGIPFIRCGVFIMDDSQQLIHTFLSTPNGKAIAAFHLPYDTPGNISQVLAHWRNKTIYTDHWDEAAFIDFADTLVKQRALASPEQYLQTIPKGGSYLHFVPFLQGMLYVGNSTALEEDEIRLVRSIAEAFSTAYARYEDFNKLEAAKQQVEKTLADLKQAQTQLVQSEKMASLGELTAGIAHEIQNPLNFVNNFSDVSNELLEEMKHELEKGHPAEAMMIVEDVKQNLEKILHHGKRADAIVKGMLQHSRTGTGQMELTDINALADEYLRLAYHGLKAKDKSFNAKFETNFDQSIEKINVVPQDIGRVILNLINNSFYAVSEKSKQAVDGFEPTVTISTRKENGHIEIRVKDNGNGIPSKYLDKIFQPFFTTKPTGQGTGLGLSLAYDAITKGHGGELKVETKEGEGTEFIIQLPNA